MDKAMTTPSKEAREAAAALWQAEGVGPSMDECWVQAFHRFQLEERERCQALMEREEAKG